LRRALARFERSQRTDFGTSFGQRSRRGRLSAAESLAATQGNRGASRVADVDRSNRRYPFWAPESESHCSSRSPQRQDGIRPEERSRMAVICNARFADSALRGEQPRCHPKLPTDHVCIPKRRAACAPCVSGAIASLALSRRRFVPSAGALAKDKPQAYLPRTYRGVRVLMVGPGLCPWAGIVTQDKHVGMWRACLSSACALGVKWFVAAGASSRSVGEAGACRTGPAASREPSWF